MTSEILKGSIAVAKMNTPACFIGEVGVCYGAGLYEGDPIYGFIFEMGRFAVLSLEDVLMTLSLTGRICDIAAGYDYTNDEQLKSDFRSGRFASAFPSLKR